ncbi:MAG: S8 family serine peptidase, partial [Bacteroidota bacterium]
MNHLIKLCGLFVAFFLTFSAQAQVLKHVQGDVIVQLAELPAGQGIKNWASNIIDQSGRKLDLEYVELISDYVGIHLLRFDYSEFDENLVLQALQRRQEVIYAQLNHLVELRETIPDDPEFISQWQYINTGQSGGTPGADIDIELAWDYTTGGLTSNGDTIVACIVDDGIDPDHPDIEPNLWVNRAEIPDNGIDDDGNGYVDDYRGWDTGSNSDGVYDGGGHGTPVTGIIGAKGNDGFGVAGVNWDVQLMIVQGGSGVESEVLQAYSYPLEQRKRYNETGGAEGAFVVVTNSSWGVDFGQPEDSPLWCNFYDSLGVQGILNCGATINGNQDVDVVGDLPTACSSPFMISVTNMNHFDEKVSQAGFGKETIDLGAFGAGTWTTAFGGGFGGFGGTSGATPHVAGTIALMYALECPSFMQLVVEDPGAAALLVRAAVLEGVDPNPSLNNITTTQGRLNVNSSMEILLQECGACIPPFAPEVVADTDTEATISWTAADEVLAINLRWREQGQQDWVLEEGATSPLVISGLTGCTTYEYQLQAACDTSSSEFGLTRTFETEGCCNNPEDISIMVSSQEPMAVLFWSAVFGAQSYELELQNLDAGGGWESFTTTQTSFMFNDLDECTEYQYRFRLICPDGANLYTDPVSFYTTGCGACTDLAYCSVVELNATEEFIGEVIIGESFTQTSESEDGGYSDFTLSGPDLELQVLTNYSISLSPEFPGQSYPEGWGVFIDLNQDGDFAANERVFVSDGVSTQPVSGVINIPNDAVRGLTRMRIIMLWNDIPDVGCGNMGEDFGEVEDYCVTISDRIDEPEEEPFFTDPTVYLEPSLLNGEVFPVQNPSDDAEALRSNPGASDRINGLSDWSLSPNPSYGQLVVSYSFDTQLAS